MSNSLDPDQSQHSVSLDLGPNCLQRLSADDKISLWLIAVLREKNGYNEICVYFRLANLVFDLNGAYLLCNTKLYRDKQVAD